METFEKMPQRVLQAVIQAGSAHLADMVEMELDGIDLRAEQGCASDLDHISAQLLALWLSPMGVA